MWAGSGLGSILYEQTGGLPLTVQSYTTVSLSLTCFESYFPVFAVVVCVDEVPEDVCPMRQRESVEKLRHSQGGQLAKL